MKTVPGQIRFTPQVGFRGLYIVLRHDAKVQRRGWLQILRLTTNGRRDTISDEYLNWRNGKVLDPEEWV